MARVSPFHAKQPSDGLLIYHDNNQCALGRTIESYNRASGTAERPKCQRCQKLH